MFNQEIREKIKKERLFHYEIAEQMGVSESYFCKLLRREMNPEKKKIVLEAIDELKRKGE